MIALGYHVDYWDYIGWKDPFADPLYTARQQNYARALRNTSTYTPQMVIGGRVDRVGSRPGEVDAAIKEQVRAASAGPAALAEERLSVPLTLSRQTGEGEETTRIIVEIAAAAVPAGAPGGDVLLAATTAARTSRVERGENAGRTLVDHNIVRLLTRLGRYDGAAASWSIEVKALPAETDMLAVWLQGPGQGPVWGAAKIELTPREE